MAKTIKQLEEELSKVSGDTRRAYDILYGTSKQNDSGLYRQLASAKNTLKKKGLFEYAKVQAEDSISNLEPRIRAAEVEYKKFQDQKNALNKELKAAKTEESTKKTNAAIAKGAANVYTDALDELSKAELGLEGYKGNEKYIDAYNKAQGAYDTLTKAGVAPKVALPQAKIEIPPLPSDPEKDGEDVKEPSLNEFITTITDPKNKQLLIDVQKDLAKNFDYKGPTDGIYAKVDKKQKEQKATVTKYKMINGVRTQVTTPGFNQIQFVTDLIKSTQEYKDIVDKKTKQEESKTLVSAQTLKGVADRNGITLSPEQLDTFTLRIKKGEDISLIQNEIRKLAAIGRPDNVKKLIESGVDLSTIYSPYKEVLAQTLEINPNGITLNDPALRMAIGPDKEMSLYDYQRALRKDPRWQYTDNARQTVSSGLTQVLRDFGFQG
jgi:hypothetical protein